MNIDVAGQVII